MADVWDVFPLLSRLLQRRESVKGSDFLPEVSVLSSGAEIQPQKEQNRDKCLFWRDDQLPDLFSQQLNSIFLPFENYWWMKQH